MKDKRQVKTSQENIRPSNKINKSIRTFRESDSHEKASTNKNIGFERINTGDFNKQRNTSEKLSKILNKLL